MNKTRIEWVRNHDGTPGYTFNPVTGCLHGCSYCYARRMCQRFAKPWGLDPADPFKPTFYKDRLNEPIKVRKSSRIFVCSMADLFGEWVPEKWIMDVLCIAATCTWHTFIFLTKNPKRYAEFDFPPNCWLGLTVVGGNDHHEYFMRRHSNLPQKIRFVSWEPILGPLDKKSIDGFPWLILGAMTGPGAKKHAPKPEWIADAVARCRERGVKVFMKDSIRPYCNGELIREWPG